MIVISNSSPLIALSRIRKLEILKRLFGTIYIPEIVYQEVVVQSTDQVQKESIVQGCCWHPCYREGVCRISKGC